MDVKRKEATSQGAASFRMPETLRLSADSRLRTNSVVERTSGIAN